MSEWSAGKDHRSIRPPSELTSTSMIPKGWRWKASNIGFEWLWCRRLTPIGLLACWKGCRRCPAVDRTGNQRGAAHFSRLAEDTDMATAIGSPRTKTLPPLENGDHLDQPTFHARYEAMPEDCRAELIGGIVY